MRHPKDIGDRSLLAVMHALNVVGVPFALPFGENRRYDLIIDTGTLRRVQCKTGRLRAGAVLFNTCSSYAHHPNPKQVKRDYQGQIDDFAVHCIELGTVYLIPIADVAARYHGSLRIEAPRNNQFKGVRLAKQYEIARFDVI